MAPTLATSAVVVALDPPKRPKRKKPIAGRIKLLARGVGIRPFVESDYAILWAAYKRGAFEGVPTGLSAAELRDELKPFLAGAIVHVVNARNLEATEVGIIVARPLDGRGYLLKPQAVWFPWASSRNRLECSVKWLNEARKTTMPMFHVELSLQGFCRHLGRYGVTREIGPQEHHPEPGKESWLYQAKRMEG